MTGIRVGLLGYGLAGAAFHAPLIAATHGLRLASIVTGNPERAAAARVRYPDAEVIASVDDVLAPGAVDLVVVATPNDSHVPLARRALEAGCDVVVYKPVAPTAVEARALAALAAEPPAKARVIPLQVAGAFHTAYMASAVEHVATLAAATTPRDAAIDLLSNADGQVVRDGRDALTRLVAQIANPVRWDLCQESLANLGVTGMIELAPGGVLAGLAKRTLRGVETVAVKTPEDLEAAADLIARHASAGAEA